MEKFNLCTSQPGTVLSSALPLVWLLLNTPNTRSGHLMNAPNVCLGSSGAFWPVEEALFTESRRHDEQNFSPLHPSHTHFKCFHIGPNNNLHLSYTQLLTLIEHLAESTGGDGVPSAEEPSVLVTGATYDVIAWWMACRETKMLLTHCFPVALQAEHGLQHVHFMVAWEKRWGCFSMLFWAWNWRWVPVKFGDVRVLLLWFKQACFHEKGAFFLITWKEIFTCEKRIIAHCEASHAKAHWRGHMYHSERPKSG